MSGAAGKRHLSKSKMELMSSLLTVLNKEVLIDEEVFFKADTEAKMEILSRAIITVNSRFETVHDIINEASDGLDPRTTDCEEKVGSLSEENKQLRFELDLIKGRFFKLETENAQLRDKVTFLSAQTMKNNLIIGGIVADKHSPKHLG